MKQAENVKYAVCVNNDGYPSSLELHKIYQIIDDPDLVDDGEIRVIDESGEDYIYFLSRFVFIEIPPEVACSFDSAA